MMRQTLWANAALGKHGGSAVASHQNTCCPANQPTHPPSPASPASPHLPLKLIVSRRPMEMRSLANLRRNSLEARLCEGAGWSAGNGSADGGGGCRAARASNRATATGGTSIRSNLSCTPVRCLLLLPPSSHSLLVNQDDTLSATCKRAVRGQQAHCTAGCGGPAVSRSAHAATA